MSHVSLAFAVAPLAVLDGLADLDERLFLWINAGLHQLHSEEVESALQVLNQLGNAWTLLPLLAVLLALLPGVAARLRFFEVALPQVIASAFVSWSKRALGRPRPMTALADAFRDEHAFAAFGEASKRNSLPSGHAATAFAFAVVLWAWAGRLPPGPRRVVARVLPFVLAVGTGVGRVFAGQHFPGDVLAGALAGIASALLVLAILGRLPPWRREREALAAGRPLGGGPLRGPSPTT